MNSKMFVKSLVHGLGTHAEREAMTLPQWDSLGVEVSKGIQVGGMRSQDNEKEALNVTDKHCLCQ